MREAVGDVAGRRTGKGKGQRDRVGKTSIRTESFQARVTDLDPTRASPYGPAACHLPHREAGHTTAPDRMHRADQNCLHQRGRPHTVSDALLPDEDLRGTALARGDWVHGRRTTRLQGLVLHSGIMLGGSARPGLGGATVVAGEQGYVPSERLDRLRLGAGASPGDRAWRRGRYYGTPICDLERRWIVDILPDLEPAKVEAWLERHPGIEIVARDRDGGYLPNGHVYSHCRLRTMKGAACLENRFPRQPPIRLSFPGKDRSPRAPSGIATSIRPIPLCASRSPPVPMAGTATPNRGWILRTTRCLKKRGRRKNVPARRAQKCPRSSRGSLSTGSPRVRVSSCRYTATSMRRISA